MGRARIKAGREVSILLQNQAKDEMIRLEETRNKMEQEWNGDRCKKVTVQQLILQNLKCRLICGRSWVIPMKTFFVNEK